MRIILGEIYSNNDNNIYSIIFLFCNGIFLQYPYFQELG
jgi:hypothetical protein